MSAPVLTRVAGALLTRAVRGRGERGTDWGEAMLRELCEVEGVWPSLRWAVSGAWAARRDRVANLPQSRLLAGLPRPARVAVRAGIALVLVAVGLGVAERFVATVRYEASAAMAPTVHVGDRIVVDRLLFHLSGLDRGDIVVVAVPGDDPAYSAVKRIVGLPGDRISCVDGRLVRDGQPVIEEYLGPDAVTACTPVTVPDGSLYLLGDAREVSRDSRQYGPVPRSGVVGRVVLTMP